MIRTESDIIKETKIEVLRDMIKVNEIMIMHYSGNKMIKRNKEFDKGYISALETSNLSLSAEIDYLIGNRNCPF